MANESNKDPFGGADYGIPRQRSRCKVVVYSHVEAKGEDIETPGIVDCSRDVISCQTSKTIKGGGGANFTVVPRRNYINYIFPNDYVDIFFDPGDGRGFIRTFFGFVDRISRSISTAENGTTTTYYQVVCSDFTKAFDVTNIYFNPHVADRDDFVGQFAGTKNIAGAQLRLKGITVYGTPADIVMNLAMLLMGFGSQFTVPKSYPKNWTDINRNRKYRVKWARDRLPDSVKKAIGKGTLTQLGEEIKRGAFTSAKKMEEEGVHLDDGTVLPIHWFGGLPDTVDSRLYSAALTYKVNQDYQLSPDFTTQPEVRALQTIEDSIADKEVSLVDLIDFTFVEYLAIDGSIVSAPIWTQQGTLWAMMNSYSNSVVNELFCDLRPLGTSYEEDLPLQSPNYVKTTGNPNADEGAFGSITHEISSSDAAIKFVPSMVMREYPFSTINSLSLADIRILAGFNVNTDIYMGAIFSKDPGIPGRKHLIITPPLHDYIAEKDKDATAYKHLDVSVISVKDIISEDVGRSDNDVANLIELYSDGLFGKHMKFITQNIQPIAIPVSVARHGLRVRTYNTRFARFSKKSTKYSGVDNVGTRTKLARWVLMLDHWYQHNIEYLNGTISTRAFPEIRVGYRLDIKERNESYYVEGVNHKWDYPNAMTSTFTLSRGQRNDPYPVYVKPQLKNFNGLRDEGNRLGDFFQQKDPEAVAKSLSLNSPGRDLETLVRAEDNLVDIPTADKSWVFDSHSNLPPGYLKAGSDEVRTRNVDEKHLATSRNLANQVNFWAKQFDIIPEAPELVLEVRSLSTKSGGVKK